MKILDFVDEVKTPFLLVQTYQNETGKKSYSGLINGYTNMTFEKSCTVAENINYTPNQIFFNIISVYIVSSYFWIISISLFH